MSEDASPGVDTDETIEHTRRTPMERAIDDWLLSLESGNYRSNAERTVREFRRFAEREHGVTTPADVDDDLCREYARDLRRDDNLAASSAHRYYAHIRSFLAWCVRDGRADTNPAERNRASEPLPQDINDPDRQFWDADTREAFLAHMDAHAHDALDEDSDHDRRAAFRDRALVYVVALSGARGAELFRVPADDRRTGLSWADVSLDRGVLSVLGKTREQQSVQLPGPAVDVLERYRQVLDDPQPDDPVFRTWHASTLAQQANTYATEYDDPVAVLREHDPSLLGISVQAARRVVKEHSEAAGLTGSDGDHLKLHGARRGLGDQLYGEQAELAQEVLRHKSIETTHKAYREQRASDRAEDVEDVLYGDE